MANNFSTDTRCKAHWRFESGALTADSIGSNTLTASASPPTADTTNFKEGSASAYFASNPNQYFSIADSALPAGFPLKSGDTKKRMTLCGRFRQVKSVFNAAYGWLFAKYDNTGNKKSFGLFQSISGYLYLYFGYNNGASAQQIGLTGALADNTWYYFVVAFDGVSKEYYFRLYNENSQNLLVHMNGNMTNQLYVSDASLTIGAYSGLAEFYGGNLDDFVVFDDVITPQEADLIFVQGYSGRLLNNFSSDSACKATWRFESGALTTDSVGSNTLTPSANPPVENLSSLREGDCAVNLVKANSNYYSIADAALASGFPLKNGDVSKKITVCYWYKSTSYTSGNKIFAKYNTTGNKRSLAIQPDNYYPTILVGYNSGASAETLSWPYVQLSNGRWFHFGWVIDGIAKTVLLRIYSFYSGDIVLSQTKTFSNELYVCDAPLMIGCDGAYASLADGTLDEMVVFNRLLTEADIDNVRNGIFSYEPRVGIYAAYVMAAYTEGSPGVTVDTAGIQVAYTLAGAKRIFPLPPANRIMQTQYQRRILP